MNPNMKDCASSGGKAVVKSHGKAYMSELGKKGGAAVKAKFGNDYFRELGRKGGAATKNRKLAVGDKSITHG